MSDAFHAHLQAAGTVQKLSVHDTPEHNGVVERLNRTLVECVCAMLHVSALPHFLWGEAVQHACWLKNHTLTRALPGTTPYEAAAGSKPDLSMVCEWGAVVWVHDPTGSKLDPQACEGHWVGLDATSKGV